MAKHSTPTCPYCNRHAANIPDLCKQAQEEGITPEQFAQEDGTFNRATNEFCCDECYIKLDQPSSTVGWVAGDPIEARA